MSSCEKCWANASMMAVLRGGSVADEYSRILKTANCTPEEQAGPQAKKCKRCARVAVHQVTGECMACGEWQDGAS